MVRYDPKFPHGIMFHYLHDNHTHPPTQGSLSAEKFDELLNFIGIRNILTPEEWIFRLKNRSLKARELCITFDDTLRCQYDVGIPILEKYGIKCFWFLYTIPFEGKPEKFEVYKRFWSTSFARIDDFYELFFKKYHAAHKKFDNRKFRINLRIKKSLFPFYSFNDLKFRFIRDEMLSREAFERLMDETIVEARGELKSLTKNLWLTRSQVRDLVKNGHYIGLHSHTHPTSLGKLSYPAQLREYSKNYAYIKDICGREPISMAHPYNSYDRKTLKILGRFHIICGFRSNIYPTKGRKINPSFLEIAREDASNIIGKMD